MRWFAAALACFIISACVAEQPESAKTVAAYEVPLPSEQDRAEFLSVVREVAREEGLHVDSSTQEHLRRTAETIPTAEMTIHAAVWRGETDEVSEAVIMDQHDHIGQVWIMFAQGVDPQFATRFRERLMREVMHRWPETLSLPIMPNGAIPLYADLDRTADGYVVDPAAAPKYSAQPPS